MNTPKQTFHQGLTQTPTCGKIKAQRKRLVCPLCNKQTLLFTLPSTEAKSLPLWCKRCEKEVVVNISLEPEP